MRQDLIAAACKFLADPKVNASPLTKQIAFLESKGLTKEEIEEAMARAKQSSSSQISPTPTTPSSTPNTTTTAATPQSLTWKDYLLGVLVTGGIGYGMVNFLQKYASEFLPSEKKMQEERDQLESHLQDATASVEVLKNESSMSRDLLERQSETIRHSLELVKDSLRHLRESSEKRDEEMKLLRTELEGVKELLPKILDKVKTSQGSVLLDLQNELKSLKGLLLNSRRSGSTLGGATTPIATTPLGGGATPTPTSVSAETAAASLASTADSSSLETEGTFTRPSLPSWQLKPADVVNPSVEE